MKSLIFKDRVDAGKQLAERLAGRVERGGLVLAIPRGGVVVGAEIARKLGLEIDLIIPRKIGSPQNPEVAVGAVTQDGSTILNKQLVEMLKITELELEEAISREIKEIKRRTALYRGTEEHKDMAGLQVVVVDDGVATGYTMFACLRSAKILHPKELILAVPVAPPDTLAQLKKEVDYAVCLHVPEDFYAVGQFYERFDQTRDEEVIKIIKELKKVKE
ncbi:phosphoribosyltransferase [Pelotomaculum propionicicum]|uniref:phosphoribosyltransferase n=1 Tax=Pelotomaculum propionicicum TaxID=258475 RepID=UPI003B7685D2